MVSIVDYKENFKFDRN